MTDAPPPGESPRARERDEMVQAVVTVCSAALSLVRPSQLRRGGSVTYRAAIAALTGASVASALVRDGGPGRRAVAGVTVAAVIGVVVAAPAAERVDERLHRALARRGLSRPRWVFATAALVLGGAGLLSDRLTGARSDARPRDEDEQGSDEP